MMMAFCSGTAYAQEKGSDVTIGGSVKQTQDSRALGGKKYSEETGKDEEMKATQVMDIGSIKNKSTSKVTIGTGITQTQDNAGNESTQVMEIGTAGTAEYADRGFKTDLNTTGDSDVVITGSVYQSQKDAENSTQVMGIGNAKDGKTTVRIHGNVVQTQKGQNAVQVMNIGNAESVDSIQRPRNKDGDANNN